MKFKWFLPPRIVLALGVLAISLVNLVNLFVPVPHFLRGFFVGIGIVWTFAGFIGIMRHRKAAA